MDWPKFKRALLFASILLLVCSVGFGKTKKPNIVFIIADDLGWDDVSFHGSPQIPTPNIDRLANNGVILNNYYVSPICTPTRASIITGKYPIRLGMQHFVIYAAQPYGLPLDEITLPQYLKTQGYRTAGVGKWHLGFFAKEYTPVNRGFDSFYGFWGSKTDYWNHSSYENDFWGIDLRDNMEPISAKNLSGIYGTELFTYEAVDIIKDHDTEVPLFLYLSHQAVHSANQNEPLQAPQDKIDKFKDTIDNEDRRKYAAMVTALDQSVGNIYEALKTKKIEDNTVIVFTTDNGGAPNGFNWNMGSNYPLRGGKDMVWEGGIKATAFVYSDLISKKGRVCHDLIDVSDWVPTLYYVAGGDPELLQPNMDGKNVWETISRGEKSPRDEILHAIDPWRNFAAIRRGRYKLVVGMDDTYQDEPWHPRYKDLLATEQPQVIPGAVLDCGERSKQDKKCDSRNGSTCLFDMVEDPCEYNDLSNQMPQMVQQLLKRLVEFQKGSRPVWYPPIDTDADPGKRGGYWGPWKELTDNSSLINGWNAISTLLVTEILGGKHGDHTEQRCQHDTRHIDEILLQVPPDLLETTKLKDLINRVNSYKDFCKSDAKMTWTANKPVEVFATEQPRNWTDRFYYRLRSKR
ncbi:arylsulfatase B-like [Actinia tenebrosa]|uniref:Arylsulfatase B-like n=1 Tax=Actinia tenebrosa TaxID=6105 RepID=A0A6P8IZK5_ACTTE|nr:arylsulfatase B-like [Actinia tenebrosa]